MKDNNVLKSTLRLYYILKIIIILFYTVIYFNGDSASAAVWLWPVQWLNHIDTPLIPIIIIFILEAIFCIWIIYTPFEKMIKFCEAILFFLFFAIYYSHSKIDHGVHGIIYSSIFISLIGKKTMDQALLMKKAIAIFAFTYGLTGLWKLRSLFLMDSIDELSLILPYQLAIDIIESGQATAIVRHFLDFKPSTNVVLWSGVISLELAGFLILWRQKLFRYWGVLIILFHFTTAVVMNIFFWEAQLLSLVFLYYVWSMPMPSYVKKGSTQMRVLEE